MADIHPGNEPGNAIRPAAPHLSNGHGPVNPTVRYEPSDVEPRNVIIFLVALTGLLVVLGVLLLGLFMLLANRERELGKADLPFARPADASAPQTVEVAPGVPQIEGSLPGKETGRAWADHMELDGEPYWLGYNVRLVPPPENEPKSDNPEKRLVKGREEVEKGVHKADAVIDQVAGKLPAAKNAAPPTDVWRQSWGEGASGRNTPRDAVRGAGPQDGKEKPKEKDGGEKGKGGEGKP
jgi:hypothetical protein